MIINMCPICGDEHRYAVGCWEGRYIVRETYCRDQSARRKIKLDTMSNLDGYAPAVALYKNDEKDGELIMIERIPKEKTKSVGKKVRQARKKKKMNQYMLAEKISYTREALAQWENGKRRIEMDTLKSIADVLEVPVEDLLGA